MNCIKIKTLQRSFQKLCCKTHSVTVDCAGINNEISRNLDRNCYKNDKNIIFFQQFQDQFGGIFILQIELLSGKKVTESTKFPIVQGFQLSSPRSLSIFRLKLNRNCENLESFEFVVSMSIIPDIFYSKLYLIL